MVALPKQREAQDGCEVPAVPPSNGTLFLTSCPITTLLRPGQLPGHCCSAGTAPKHSQALPSWAPNYGETADIPFQLFPGERGRAPSAVFQHGSTKEKQQQLFQHEGEELPFPCPKTSVKGALCSSWPPLHPRKDSGVAEGHLPPQPPTQAVLDPALLPLLHCCHLVG